MWGNVFLKHCHFCPELCAPFEISDVYLYTHVYVQIHVCTDIENIAIVATEWACFLSIHLHFRDICESPRSGRVFCQYIYILEIYVQICKYMCVSLRAYSYTHIHTRVDTFTYQRCICRWVCNTKMSVWCVNVCAYLFAVFLICKCIHKNTCTWYINVYKYVCIYLCYSHIDICVCVCVYIHMHTLTCIRSFRCVYIHIYVSTYVHVCADLNTYEQIRKVYLCLYLWL